MKPSSLLLLLLAAVCCGCVVALDQNQEVALQDLFTACNGNNWVKREGWLQDPDPCKWQGVECDGTSTFVSKLSLESNNLKCVLPASIGTFGPSLLTLDLSGNQISGDIPDRIGELVALQTLDLGDNQIVRLPTDINKMVNVLYLDISNNKLTSPLPAGLGTMFGLRTLIVDENKGITELPSLARLVNMHSLSAEKCGLLSLNSVGLAGLTAMINIDVDDNAITGTLPDLQALTRLKTLSAERNGITQFPDLAVTNSELENLWLEGNKIPTIITTIMNGLTALKQLRIGRNPLDNLPPQVAQPSLQYLSCVEAPGLASVPSQLGALTALNHLNLKGSGMPSLPPQLATGPAGQSLRFMDVSDTNINNANTFPWGSTKLLQLFANNCGNPKLDSTGLGLISTIPNLESLEVRSNGITTVPGVFATLDELLYIDLSANGITTLPTELAGMQNLQTVIANNNNLATIGPGIESAPSLIKLFLNNNKITNIGTSIFNARNLIDLSLDNNQITSLPPQVGDLTKLFNLLLAKNRLSSLPTEIGQLATLRTLDLDTNNITTLPTEINNLEALVQLDVSFNQLSTFPSMSKMQELDLISFSSNQGFQVWPTSVNEIVGLQFILAADCGMTGPFPPIANQARLKSVILKGNSFTGPMPAALFELATSLRNIDVAGNSLSGPLPPTVANVANRDLSGNHWQCPIPADLANDGLQCVDMPTIATGGIAPTSGCTFTATPTVITTGDDVPNTNPSQLKCRFGNLVVPGVRQGDRSIACNAPPSATGDGPIPVAVAFFGDDFSTTGGITFTYQEGPCAPSSKPKTTTGGGGDDGLGGGFVALLIVVIILAVVVVVVVLVAVRMYLKKKQLEGDHKSYRLLEDGGAGGRGR